MKWPRSTCAALALAFAACESTGDPRQGGLYGWSETKARRRQADRRAEVAAAEAQLGRERQRAGQLRARDASATHQLALADAENERTRAQLRAREFALLERATQLETVSPTPATASRARKLRMQVETVLADRALTSPNRARQLRELEVEIESAYADVNR